MALNAHVKTNRADITDTGRDARRHLWVLLGVERLLRIRAGYIALHNCYSKRVPILEVEICVLPQTTRNQGPKLPLLAVSYLSAVFV